MPRDSFDPAPAPDPGTVTELKIFFIVRDGTPNTYDARYEFTVPEPGADGEARGGSLIPHLTGAQITTAKAFLDAMLTKAQTAGG